jgi:DNA-binding MarR family transcriptional regulator
MTGRKKNFFNAWNTLLRTHQKLIDAVECSLQKEGLPPLCWYDALREISNAENQRMRLQDICARLVLARNNTTRLVDRLVKEELVLRKKCPQDRRGVYAEITPKGKALLKKMEPIYSKAIEEHFGQHLDKNDIQSLMRIYASFQKKE